MSVPPPPRFLIDYQVDEICRSYLFDKEEQLQKLLRYLVRQTARGEITTEAVLAVELWSDPKTGKSTVRMAVKRLREKVDKYYELPEGKTAIIIIKIPLVGGWDPHTGILYTGVKKHYHANISFHPMMLDAAKNFSNALYLKYRLDINDGEAWFETGREPTSLLRNVRDIEDRKAALKNLLNNSFVAGPAVDREVVDIGRDTRNPSDSSEISRDQIELESLDDLTHNPGILADSLCDTILQIARDHRRKADVIRFIRLYLEEGLTEACEAGAIILQFINHLNLIGEQSSELHAEAALANSSLLLSAVGLHKCKRAVEAMLAEMDSEAFRKRSSKSMTSALEKIVRIFFDGTNMERSAARALRKLEPRFNRAWEKRASQAAVEKSLSEPRDVGD